MASFPVACIKQYNTMRNVYGKGLSPYEDWICLGCPTKAAFRYTDQKMKDAYTLIYDPNLNSLYIDIRYGYWSMTAVAIIQVQHESRQLCVHSASCRAINEWPVMNSRYTPHGIGGARFLRRSLNHVRWLDILSKVAKEFFGITWSFNHIRRGTLYDKKIIDAMCDLGDGDNLFQTHAPWYGTSAVFDTTKEAAATRIQAAFRGWKTRMKYRYNPYNSLGKYVALRNAGFI